MSGDWVKTDSVYCSEGYDELYLNFELVKAACLADDNCAAIADRECRGWFHRCPKGFKEEPSVFGTCIYHRPGTLQGNNWISRAAVTD